MPSARKLFLALVLLLSNLALISPAHAGLYAFTSQTFTACGASGQSGPTLANCTSAYSAATWTSSTANFNVTSGIQYWTVPGTGSYTVDIYGAKGGNATSTSFVGGKGVRARMTVSLTQGQIIKILVGQPGGSYGYTAGGGGGTFVHNSTTATLIAAAGGGGGAGDSGGNGYAASLYSSGVTGYQFSGGSSGGGGSGGSGWGTGGAGFSGNGIGGGSGGTSWDSGANPLAFTAGGTGAGASGTSPSLSCNGAPGGFGGGGGGQCNGGGGGGGFSGGSGGGGGGGTFTSGSTVTTSVITDSTASQVIITATTPVTVDTTPPVLTGPGSVTGSTSSISIQENSTTVFTMSANESATWTVSGTDSSFFAIGSATGALTITSRNFENKADANADNVYIVIITATDSNSNAVTQTLSVTITNVNEAPVIGNNASGAAYAITQAENISTLATYVATDVDTQTTLTFTLSGSDSSDFSINSTSGTLVFVTNPDFEAPTDSDANNIYTFIVIVSDGSLTDSQTVTLSITDVNESSVSQIPTLSAPAAKGASVTISLSINVTSKVMFFANGKRIAACKVRVTSGTYPNNVATCLWKPTVSGAVKLTALITPVTAGFASSTSPALNVFVGRRSGMRS